MITSTFRWSLDYVILTVNLVFSQIPSAHVSQEGDCILSLKYVCAKAPDGSRASMFHSKSGLLALQFQRVFQ